MLAMIAGQGRLPGVLAAAFLAKARPFRICHLFGFPPEATVAPDLERTEFRIEHLGSFLAELVASGVTQVVFAGAIRRPPLDPTKIDPATVLLVPAMMQALHSGDDAALRTVIGFFEEAGMSVVGAHEVVPGLLPDAGILTQAAPSDRDRNDVARADKIVAALGAVDVGQGAVVAKGQALAVEAFPGTDAMLGQVADMRNGDVPDGGILWKAPKPGQDQRIDMPTVGPDTIRNAAAAGLSGVAVPEGGVLLLDRDAAVEAADAAGLFLWVRGAGEIG